MSHLIRKSHIVGGEFWTDRYYVSTVGPHATEEVIRQYVKNQGLDKDYQRVHAQQLNLF